LGSGERLAVESLARLIMQHLLLTEHSPAIDQRDHWQDEIDEFRTQLGERLSKSLGNHLEGELDAVYGRARRLVARKMRAYRETADTLPRERPYSLDQVVGDDWLPAGLEA
jgi:hypothetical protein